MSRSSCASSNGPAVRGETFVVGVVGEPEFREAMDALDGYRVGDRAIEVRHVKAPEALDGLHVLVVGPSPSDEQADQYLRVARERPILTVGDATDFGQAGGIVQFVVVEDTVRFEINLDAAERVGLKVELATAAAGPQRPEAELVRSPAGSFQSGSNSNQLHPAPRSRARRARRRRDRRAAGS